jgi:hypothetical protein
MLFEQNNNILNEDDILNIVEIEQEINDIDNEVCFFNNIIDILYYLKNYLLIILYYN